MENNITLQGQGADIRTSLQNIANSSVWQNNLTNSSVWQNIVNAAKAPVEWLRAYYSSVCDKNLTMTQTLLLVNTQIAFLFAALPADMPVVARLAGVAWLLVSLKKCKESI